MKNGLTKLLSLLTISFLMVACFGGGDISLVKSGVLGIDDSITVGEAIDNYKYFKDVKWESFKTENGRRVVQVTGNLNLNDLKNVSKNKWMVEGLLKKGYIKADVIFQFLISKDGKKFRLYTEAVDFYKKDGTIEHGNDLSLSDALHDLKLIYNNESIL